jgi:hypothetical protein
VAVQLAALAEEHFVNSFVDLVAGRCRTVVVGEEVDQMPVSHCRLVWVEVGAALMHHTGRNFANGEGIDTPC